ncbi:MAG: phosphoribosylamine--glycine ligase [Rhodospirillales bacterium RIFCSPLOWO2_12_FULL_67_15]|nr:MAG: phosphoribosylamine--glycine ligase [Rhodospirillales bacterium RIFCSPLOWO2_12_FULL_67_15]
MKVLVVGSGGREHALCWAIAKSSRCTKLYCAPGNPGIAAVAECVEVAPEDLDGVVAFARDHAVDFVVVGPEAPLVAGLGDRLAAAGIAVFGPSQAAAEIEGSKTLMKDLCAKYGIATANYARFDEPDAAKEYIRARGAPIVVKANGLAAGKGVTVCHNVNEAYAAIDHVMTEQTFGTSGDEVVIEQYLEGEEVSFFALVDGARAIPFGACQDHKARDDGDKGPNTGGMGAYSPTPLVSPALEREIMARCILPMAKGLVVEGKPYRGVLFAGLMMTPDGPKVLEYNARFGDPECQVLMARLKSDALEALYACATGRLDRIVVDWRAEAALTVVMAAKGYPGSYEKGTEILGLAEAEEIEGVYVFHAGTRRENGRLLATGGRVLGVTALGATVAEAQRNAYEAVDRIRWPGGFCRRDIGWRAIRRAG